MTRGRPGAGGRRGIGSGLFRLCQQCGRAFRVNPVERPAFCSLACAERGRSGHGGRLAGLAFGPAFTAALGLEAVQFVALDRVQRSDAHGLDTPALDGLPERMARHVQFFSSLDQQHDILPHGARVRNQRLCVQSSTLDIIGAIG